MSILINGTEQYDRNATCENVVITKVTCNKTEYPLCRRESDGAVGCYDTKNNQFVEFVGGHYDGASND